MNYKLIFLLKLFMILILSANSSVASFNAEGCVERPILLDYEYIESNTLYGFAKQNIDIKNHVPEEIGCQAQDRTLRICVKNPNSENSNDVCDIININEGTSLKLFNNNKYDLPDGSPHPLASISFQALIYDNKFCLYMPTPLGLAPVLCRNFDGEAQRVGDTFIENCRIAQSCFKSNYEYSASNPNEINISRSIFNFTGKTMQCTRETFDQIFYSEDLCADNNDHVTVINNFSYFQNLLKGAVFTALILYTMLFGVKILLGAENMAKGDAVWFVLKIILVTYFSVGIGFITFKGGSIRANDGMRAWGLPLLQGTMNGFANMVFSAGGTQGLCHFDPKDYPDGHGYYALWDSIDCRIGFYFGLRVLYDFGGYLASGDIVSESKNGNAPSSLDKAGTFSYLIVLFFFFVMGQFVVLFFSICFAVVFFSMILQFFGTFLICTITMFVLAYLGPIFIPLVLFEQTKQYFNAWLKLLVGCALQPMVLAAFIALMLNAFDNMFYGSCHFVKDTVNLGALGDLDVFRLDPNSLYEIDDSGTEHEVGGEGCKSSIGFKLMTAYQGHGWDTYDAFLFIVYFLGDIGAFLYDMAYMAFYALIFLHFSKSLNGFAAGLVSGASTSGLIRNAVEAGQSLSNGIDNVKSGWKNIKGQPKAGAGKDAISSNRAGNASANGSGNNPQATQQEQGEIKRQNETGKNALNTGSRTGNFLAGGANDAPQTESELKKSSQGGDSGEQGSDSISGNSNEVSRKSEINNPRGDDTGKDQDSIEDTSKQKQKGNLLQSSDEKSTEQKDVSNPKGNSQKISGDDEPRNK